MLHVSFTVQQKFAYQDQKSTKVGKMFCVKHQKNIADIIEIKTA